MRARLLVLLLIALTLVGCDHATKQVAVTQFRDAPHELLGGVLTLTYTENRDMAFGLLGQLLNAEARLWVLTAAKAVAVIFGVAFLVLRNARASWRELLAVALIVAGAAGNLIDRVARGYVVDFLRVPYWPVFNVADIAVCVGAGLLLLGMLGNRKTMQLSGSARIS